MNYKDIRIALVFCVGLLLLFQSTAISFAAVKKPIKIGVTVSKEGKYKEPSEMIYNSFRLWENEINKKGGLLGRPVKLIVYNDKSDVATMLKLYQKLILQDKVDIVFSPYGSPLTLAVGEITEKHGMVMLAAAASAEAVWEKGYKSVFGVYALGKRYFIGQLDLMARKGKKSIGLLYDETSPFNVEVIDGTEKWANRFRVKVLLKKGFRDGAKELPIIVDALQRANPHGLVVSAYPPDCYLILELLNKAGYKPEIMGMTIAPIHPDFQKKAGPIADGVFGPSQWEPDERIPFPGTKKFIASFKQYTGKMPSYHAGSAYSSCQLWEQAIKKVGSLDQKAIRDYIADLDTVTVIGRFKVDASGKQVGHNPILIQWQNGKKEIVWPQNMRTAAPKL